MNGCGKKFILWYNMDERFYLIQSGRKHMEIVTLQGPVVVLPEKEYQEFNERIARLEKIVEHLITIIEDREDIQVMREAEVEYRAGDSIDFDELLADMKAEAID